jgi:type IV pilus assembly protein PilX
MKDFGKSQRGAVLVIALVMLVVLTVLGVGTSRNSLLEERLTGNTQDAGIAFQAAEASLREGERFLQQPELPYFEGLDGLYRPAAPGEQPLWASVDWSTEARTYTGMAGAPGSLALANAAFFIEELPPVVPPGESLAADAPVDELRFFRVTARGVGATGNTTAVLQTTYRR